MKRFLLAAESVAILQVAPVEQSACLVHDGAQAATMDAPLLKTSTHACGVVALQSLSLEQISVQKPSQVGQLSEAQEAGEVQAVPTGSPLVFP
jgi:hypothetical protein